MNRVEHWEHVYQTKAPEQVSWFQAEARLSLRLVVSLTPERSSAIIDIGAGASTLVDGLLDLGYRNLTILDVSPAALRVTQRRLGSRADSVHWLAADILDAALPVAAFDVWHDRAVFHFLTTETDQQRYVTQVRTALKPGGLLVVATFAEDGPMRCSGLEVARYAPAELHAKFGAPFVLLESHREIHTTPGGSTQAFTYCAFRMGIADPQ